MTLCSLKRHEQKKKMWSNTMQICSHGDMHCKNFHVPTSREKKQSRHNRWCFNGKQKLTRCLFSYYCSANINLSLLSPSLQQHSLVVEIWASSAHTKVTYLKWEIWSENERLSAEMAVHTLGSTVF